MIVARRPQQSDGLAQRCRFIQPLPSGFVSVDTIANFARRLGREKRFYRVFRHNPERFVAGRWQIELRRPSRVGMTGVTDLDDLVRGHLLCAELCQRDVDRIAVIAVDGEHRVFAAHPDPLQRVSAVQNNVHDVMRVRAGLVPCGGVSGAGECPGGFDAEGEVPPGRQAEYAEAGIDARAARYRAGPADREVTCWYSDADAVEPALACRGARQ